MAKKEKSCSKCKQSVSVYNRDKILVGIQCNCKSSSQSGKKKTLEEAKTFFCNDFAERGI